LFTGFSFGGLGILGVWLEFLNEKFAEAPWEEITDFFDNLFK